MNHKVEYCDRKLTISPYYYCLVLNEETYYQELAKLDIPPYMGGAWLNSGADATAHFFIHGATNRKVCIVSFDDKKKATPTQKCGLLAHEAVHIFQKICEEIGESSPSSEFEAYSIQTIFEELLYAYDRAKSELSKSSKKPIKQPSTKQKSK